MDTQQPVGGGLPNNQVPVLDSSPAPVNPNRFNKILLIILVVALVLAGVSYAGIWYWQKQNSQIVIPTYTPRPNPTADWKTYTNTHLGFSINIPKEEKNGSMKVIESGDITFFLVDTPADNKRIEEIIKSDRSEVEKSVRPWAVLVRIVNSQTELDKLIKERYGEKCAVGEMKSSEQSGVFNVEIGGEHGPEACFVNYITQIKYSPALKKVAIWDIGQDINFMLKDGEGADFDMIKSFRFLGL